MEGSCNLETLDLKLPACAVQYLYYCNYIRYTYSTTYTQRFSPCRVTREGWPLLLLNLRQMGAHRVQIKAVLHWLVRWACRAGTRDFCSALAALVGPAQNIFFLTVHYFNTCVPIHESVSPQPQSIPLRPFLYLSISLC
jgi:hypothetical protein